MAKTETDSTESQRLRRAMRDVVALSTMPAVWSGMRPEGVANSLAGVLLNTLSLDLVFIQFEQGRGQPPVTVLQGRAGEVLAQEQVDQVRESLLRAVGGSAVATVPNPLADDDLRITVTRFGVSEDHGLLIAGSARVDFPTEQDRLLLGVGANQAAVVLQRSRAEREVRRSEEELADFFESATVGMHWVGPDGRILRANKAELDLLGYTREEYIGQPIADFHADEDVICDILNRLRAGERLTQYPARLRCKNGDIRSVLIDSSVRWQDGQFMHTRCFTHDVTDRVRAEAATRAQEQKTRAILESISDAFCALDREWRFSYVNHQAEVLLGRSREDLLGRSHWDVYADTVGTELERAYRRAVADNVSVTIELYYPPHERWYEVHGYPSAEGLSIYFHDVSDRKRVELVLSESEKRFRELADAMPHIVWTAGPDGQIDYLNQRWKEFTGMPDTASNDAWARLLHPDDAAESRRRWAESLERGVPFDMEMRLFDHRRDSYRWHLVRTIPVHDADGAVRRWFGTGTDIDEQKCAQRTSAYLAEASAALAEVADYESTLKKIATLAVPYFADWAAADVVENGQLRRLAVAHRDPDKIEIAHELARKYPDDLESSRGIAEVLRTGKPQFGTTITDEQLQRGAIDAEHLRLLRSLGLKSYISVPLTASGVAFGALTFVTAESGRQYTADDLAVAGDLARRASVAVENTRLYEALRDADRRKDEFLATLAHELRNPLAPISNGLQILAIPHVGADAIERARGVMRRQVDHMVRLVDDLLDVSRVMRGRIELRREQVEFSTVIARAVEIAQPLIDAQRHSLELAVASESLLMNADPVRLAQVVSNLLANAAKYTPAGGKIRLTAAREKSALVLRIQDNGVGIAPHMLTRIFELFVQVDHDGLRSQGGLGIGLTLVKNLVEMHDGSVEARSAGTGQGAELIVRLPLSSPARTADVPPRRPARSVDDQRGSGCRVLLVDDNQDAATSLATLLELEGHDVRVAFGGQDALKIARHYVPDVALIDLGMPGMDGFELRGLLRRQPGYEHVIFVALTGWGQQDDRRRTAAAGFNHHLVKPPDLDALEQMLPRSKALGPELF